MGAETDSTSPELEAQKDAGTGQQGQWNRWSQEMQLARKQRRTWRVQAAQLEARYRNQIHTSAESPKFRQKNLNLFFANTRIIHPAVFSNEPKTVVSRRFRDRDPIGRAGSLILERALDFTTDEYNFWGMLDRAALDASISGLGTVRVRYLSEIERTRDVDTDGNEVFNENILFETTQAEFVHHSEWTHGSSRVWENVPWITYNHYMTRAELKDRFGDIGAKVPLLDAPAALSDKTTSTTDDQKPPDISAIKRAEVWEIWDKGSGKVIWMAPLLADVILDEHEPEIAFTGFFDMPEPLRLVPTVDDMIPVPPGSQYLEQLVELDLVTQRIHNLVHTVKLRGVYPGEHKQLLANLFSGENILVPVEGWSKFSEQGKLGEIIEWVPLEEVVKALAQLYQIRDQIKAEIFEISGISDIIRGDTDPRETARAQQLKGRFASSRLEDPQRRVARWARDVMRLKAEVIAENFAADTIRQVSGWDQLLSDSEPLSADTASPNLPRGIGDNGGPPMGGQPGGLRAQPIGQQVAQSQLAMDQMEMAKKARHDQLFDQALDLISIDTLRGFRIEIETESTLAFDEASEREDRMQFISSISGFMREAVSAAQQVPEIAPLAMDLLEFAVRSFRVGKPLEARFENATRAIREAAKAARENPQQQKDPRVEVKEMDIQSKERMQQRQLEQKREETALEAQIDVAKLESDQRASARDAELTAEEILRKRRADNIQGLASILAGDRQAVRESE